MNVFFLLLHIITIMTQWLYNNSPRKMENMHVLAMLLPVVNNQKVNEINTRIKTGP